MTREILGTFTVTGGNSRQQTVYICQLTHLDETGAIKEAGKEFTLDGPEGETVSRTRDPNTYIAEDGTVLRKAGPIQFGETGPETGRPRRRRQH